jgi:hypothetical protein
MFCFIVDNTSPNPRLVKVQGGGVKAVIYLELLGISQM